MHVLISQLVPIIVLVVIALVIWYAAERFSPDPFLTKVVHIIVFAVVLIILLTKLFPMLGLG